MRTVRELKAELDKFPEDSICSGVQNGILIQDPNEIRTNGFIYCHALPYGGDKKSLPIKPRRFKYPIIGENWNPDGEKECIL